MNFEEIMHICPSCLTFAPNGCDLGAERTKLKSHCRWLVTRRIDFATFGQIYLYLCGNNLGGNM